MWGPQDSQVGEHNSKNYILFMVLITYNELVTGAFVNQLTSLGGLTLYVSHNQRVFHPVTLWDRPTSRGHSGSYSPLRIGVVGWYLKFSGENHGKPPKSSHDWRPHFAASNGSSHVQIEYFMGIFFALLRHSQIWNVTNNRKDYTATIPKCCFSLLLSTSS